MFKVEAFSLTPMTYQWYRDGAKIGGTQDSTCVINNVNPGKAGNYYVRIGNASGSITSSNAALIVLPEPTNSIVRLLSPRLSTNGFELQLSGPAGSNYVIMTSTDLVHWVPISTNATPAGTVNYTDPSATNFGYRYYRAVLR